MRTFFAILALVCTAGCATHGTTMQHEDAGITMTGWGTVDGTPVHLWTLRNGKGMTMRVTDYGTIVTELWVPDAKGRTVDVVLGRPTAADYVARTQYFGCTAGRCANRIARGAFAIDGKPYRVTANNGLNTLHGGAKGFDKVVWTGTAAMTPDGPGVTFTYVSKDGEEGFPGTVTAEVTYVLTSRNELDVRMTATTDAPTVVNLAHHSYWNLSGHASGSILGHELVLPADRYTPVDASLVTTGAIDPVADTPLDFRTAKAIGRDIGRLPATKDDPGGYDHNFVVNGEPVAMRTCAVLRDPASGRTMTIRSNQPGIQFYSGNFLDGIPGKEGATYRTHDGLCLETQAFPDSINKQGVPGWPDVVLRPGQRYEHRMVHEFR